MSRYTSFVQEGPGAGLNIMQRLLLNFYPIRLEFEDSNTLLEQLIELFQ